MRGSSLPRADGNTEELTRDQLRTAAGTISKASGHAFGGSVTQTGDDWTTAASFNLTLPTGTSGIVAVWGSCGHVTFISGAVSLFRFQIGSDNSNEVRLQHQPNPVALNHLFTGLTAGTHTVRLQFDFSAMGTRQVQDCNLMALEV